MTHHAVLVRDIDPLSTSIEIDERESVQDQYFEKMTIDQVRSLTESAHRRPPEGSDTVLFVVRTSFITTEAQHALLKLLEEPPLTTRFVFVIPPDLSLLATVLSRFHQQTHTTTESISESFTEFQACSLKERLERIETATKNKNESWQRSIKQGLIVFLQTNSIETATVLIDLEFVAAHLLTRGASNKMLLEQLALTLPLKGN